jgi:hypothetical protein
LPSAIVENTTLAPQGPAYKALVLRSTDLLTSQGVIKLTQYASEGLPIIISGGIPDQIDSTTGVAEAQETLRNITSLPNVHQIPAGPLAPTLSTLGIEPWTKVSANDTWYTYWRDGTEHYDSAVYIYNDGNYSEGTVSFASTGTPFFLDAWTGEETPILNYTVEYGRTTITLNLASAQSIFIGFSSSVHGANPIHVTSASSSILGFSYDKHSGLIAKVAPSSVESLVVTSDDQHHTIPAFKNVSPFTLGDWTLVAEKWGPPANLSDIDIVAIKTNTTHILPALQSWPDIPGLANTSGVGYYTTTFTWPSTSVGAIIDFGRVVHTLRVKINGNQLPALDFASAKADITPYLCQGNNLVEAIVATTMINGLFPIVDKLKTSGSGPPFGASTFASLQVEAGLVDDVVVTPYNPVKIAS